MGWYTYDVHFERGWGVKTKMRCYRTKWGEGLASVLDVQSLFFYQRKLDLYHARHHAEPNIKILLTRNLLFDTNVRQWSHPLMIPLHVCGLKRTIEPVVNLNVTWLVFLFCFDFLRSHAQCGCCSIVCLHFSVV